MNFAHLIQINDSGNPLAAPLTREQLWHGLVLRAERPTLFVMGLDRCEIIGRAQTGIVRRLHFGKLLIQDEVRFFPSRKVHYFVPEQEDIPASSLTMTIEEPQPESLFVRFEYDDARVAADTADAFYDEFRRSAYQEADIDTIRVIRQLAATGKLDTPLQ